MTANSRRKVTFANQRMPKANTTTKCGHENFKYKTQQRENVLTCGRTKEECNESSIAHARVIVYHVIHRYSGVVSPDQVSLSLLLLLGYVVFVG
jgi:hypothetical protein